MIDYTFPITIGEDEVLDERACLTEVQKGLQMDNPESIRFIVIHCSATRADRDYTVEQLLKDHKARGFRTIGYHFYIRKSGEVTQHRRLSEVGAHAKGYNRCSIGICYEGGLVAEGEVKREKLKVKSNADARSPEQKNNADAGNPEQNNNVAARTSEQKNIADARTQEQKKQATRLIPTDTRTPEQKQALIELLYNLHEVFPNAIILGHRDLSGVKKACPCFNAGSEYYKLFPPAEE